MLRKFHYNETRSFISCHILHRDRKKWRLGETQDAYKCFEGKTEGQGISARPNRSLVLMVTPRHACASTDGRRRNISNPFVTWPLEVGVVSAPRTGRFTSKERIGSHCREVWVDLKEQQGKTYPPPAFNPRTVQPLASCYTNYAVPAA
jgi:hypothetical protein